MGMRVTSRQILDACCKKHNNSEEALKAWLNEAENACWKSPLDIKKRYPSADILHDNRIVFNIKGNRFRLIVKINYNVQIVQIRFADTHAEYDKIDAGSV
jgi:mRNA interferase HigB